MVSTELSPHITSFTINPLQPLSVQSLLLPLDLGNHWFACSPHTYVYVVCLHLFSHLWAHICVHRHLEAGGQHYVSSLMILCFIQWGRVSYWDVLFWSWPRYLALGIYWLVLCAHSVFMWVLWIWTLVLTFAQWLYYTVYAVTALYRLSHLMALDLVSVHINFPFWTLCILFL